MPVGSPERFPRLLKDSARLPLIETYLAGLPQLEPARGSLIASWGGWPGPGSRPFDDLPKSMPKHLRGDAKDIAEELISEGLLIPKQTGYGLHVSLNPQRKATIDEIIKEGLGE